MASRAARRLLHKVASSSNALLGKSTAYGRHGFCPSIAIRHDKHLAASLGAHRFFSGLDRADKGANNVRSGGSIDSDKRGVQPSKEGLIASIKDVDAALGFENDVEDDIQNVVSKFDSDLDDLDQVSSELHEEGGPPRATLQRQVENMGLKRGATGQRQGEHGIDRYLDGLKGSARELRDRNHVANEMAGATVDVEKEKLDAEEARRREDFGGQDGDGALPIRDDLMVRIVGNSRVQKVTKGGVELTQKSILLVGNGRGAVGYGIGRGKTLKDATLRAAKQAQERMYCVELYRNRTLYHDVSGSFNGTKVLIKIAGDGYGLVACPLVTAILELAGVKDASTKVIGNRNTYSIIKATFKALAKSTSLEEQARARGLRLVDINEQWEAYYNRYRSARPSRATAPGA